MEKMVQEQEKGYERRAQESYYKIKRRLKGFMGYKKPFDKLPSFASDPATIRTFQGLLHSLDKTDKSFRTEMLDKIERTLGQHYVRLLERASKLEGDESFNLKNPKRSKALGYEGTWLADDTLASNALYVYKELNKRGYDKNQISQRVAQLKEFQEQIEKRIKSFRYGEDSLKEGYEFPREYDYGRHLEATRGDTSRFLDQIQSELESQKSIGQKYEGRNLRNKSRNRAKQKINR